MKFVLDFDLIIFWKISYDFLRGFALFGESLTIDFKFSYFFKEFFF